MTMSEHNAAVNATSNPDKTEEDMDLKDLKTSGEKGPEGKEDAEPAD